MTDRNRRELLKTDHNFANFTSHKILSCGFFSVLPSNDTKPVEFHEEKMMQLLSLSLQSLAAAETHTDRHTDRHNDRHTNRHTNPAAAAFGVWKKVNANVGGAVRSAPRTPGTTTTTRGRGRGGGGGSILLPITFAALSISDVVVVICAV